MNEKIKSEKKSIKKNVLYILGLPIVGVILTLVTQQVFFKQNQRIQFQRELVKEQLPYYNKILRFCEIGSKMEIHVIHNVTYTIFKDKTEKELDRLEGTKEISYIMPSIIMNKNQLTEWENLRNDIEKNKDFIDHDIYLAFKDVVKFYDTNKPKNAINSEDISNSKWSDRAFVGDWSAENLYLQRMVEKFIRLN